MILDSQVRALGSGSQSVQFSLEQDFDQKVCTHNPEWRGILLAPSVLYGQKVTMKRRQELHGQAEEMEKETNRRIRRLRRRIHALANRFHIQ